MARKLPKVVNKKGVEDMLRQINTRCPTGCRNYAIVMIMYRAGLRVQEVCNLTLADINTETGSIYIQQGKGKKDRYSYMDESALQAVKNWLMIKPESEYFFCTLQGGQIDSRYIREVCYRISKKAGVFIQDGQKQKPVSPHKLRHTCLTGLLNAGFNIRQVQEIAGHSSLNTTMIYTHVDNEELAAKMRKRML